MESVSLYSETRVEYLKQLSMWLIPPMVEFFRNEYNNIHKQDETLSMAAFQKYCSEIPKWNQDVIDTHVATIMDNCHCDYIEELMTAVFIAHTKMLTAIRVNSRNKKLQITLPKLDHFLHRVFIECARSFWKSPYIFSDEFPPIERQKNILQAEAMCTEALSGAVRSLLPVKSILKDYLEDDDVEESEDSKRYVHDTKKRGEEKKLAEQEAEEETERKKAEEEEALRKKAEEEEAERKKAEEEEAERKKAEEEEEAERKKAEEEEALRKKAEEEEEALRKKVAKEEALRRKIEKEEALQRKAEEALHRKVEDETIATRTFQEEADGGMRPISILKSQSSVEQMPTNRIQIETEPVVHFTPYDTVYDHSTNDISEIRYSPKVSMEDRESGSPKLVIHSKDQLHAIDSIDLDAPSIKSIDVPLNSTIDFVELS